MHNKVVHTKNAVTFPYHFCMNKIEHVKQRGENEIKNKRLL